MRGPTRTWKLAGVAAASGAVALLCAAATRPAARAVVEFPPPTLASLVTITGAHSKVTVARCERITTPEAWAALWLEHLGEPPKAKYDTYYNKAGLPMVDFDRCMVVAVFGGELTNVAGYGCVSPPLESSAGGKGAADSTPAAAGDADAGDAAPADARDAILRFDSHSFQTAGPEPDGGAQHNTPFAFFVVQRTHAPLVVELVQRGKRGPEHDRVHERGRFPVLPEVLPASTPVPVEGR